MVTLGRGCGWGAATVSGRQVLRGEISINGQQEHFDPQSDNMKTVLHACWLGS